MTFVVRLILGIDAVVSTERTDRRRATLRVTFARRLRSRWMGMCAIDLLLIDELADGLTEQGDGILGRGQLRLRANMPSELIDDQRTVFWQHAAYQFAQFHLDDVGQLIELLSRLDEIAFR